MILNTVLPYHIFDYGDGSNNTVQSGYNSSLYFNNAQVTPQSGNIYGASNFTGRLDSYTPVLALFPNIASNKTTGITSGTNTITTTIDASTEEQTVFIDITAGYTGLVTNGSISALQFQIDGSWYSLKDMADAKYIKPLVVLDGAYSISGRAWDVLGLYDNSSGTNTANYPGAYVIFMLNKGYSITKFRLTTNRAWGQADYISWDCAPLKDARLTVAPY